MRSASRQGGVGLLLALIIAVAIAAIVLATMLVFQTKHTNSRSAELSGHFATVAAAIEQFAAASGRLPCPADPASSTGDALPASASATCAKGAGVIPWKTIGLRSDDALDPWGWKISYRVYTGCDTCAPPVVAGSGSLTQTDGASEVNCDIVEPLSAGTTPVSGSSGGTCRATYNTMPAEYIAGKGLQVSDNGTIRTGIAYVLISHGPTGQGAYTTTAVQNLPMPTSADELANLGASGPFISRGANTSGLGSTASAFFDDTVWYRSLDDLISATHLTAREWPEPNGGFAALNFDGATLGSATTGTVPSHGDLNTQTVTFQNARVTGFNSSGNQNLAFDTAGGAEGLGGGGGGTNMLSSNGAEGIRVKLGQAASGFGVTLGDFGSGTFLFLGFIPFPYAEQVEFKLYDTSVDASSPIADIVKAGCHADHGLASFSISAPGGASFDQVEIIAKPSTIGATVASTFLVSAISSCASTTCATSLDNVANHCP